MKNLFEPCQAGNLHLASRIVMAPLTRNRAPHGLANALMAEYYAQRAQASSSQKQPPSATKVKAMQMCQAFGLQSKWRHGNP
jgi:2,4-dienoyl-CoA reductase-like NADH-dependent reductase (Old Yellow Enzyme family)